jgi:hypothetical protein
MKDINCIDVRELIYGEECIVFSLCLPKMGATDW